MDGAKWNSESTADMNPPVWADLLQLLGMVFLLALNAYFVAAEFALVTVRWTRVEQLIEEGRFGAIAVREAIERLDDAVAACQVGITFASLGLGWIGEPPLAHLLLPLFHGLPVVWGIVLSHVAAVALAYLILTYLHVVIGEQAPKALALRRAENVALLVTGPLLTFGRLFRPFIKAIGGSGQPLVPLARLPAPIQDQNHHLLCPDSVPFRRMPQTRVRLRAHQIYCQQQVLAWGHD